MAKKSNQNPNNDYFTLTFAAIFLAVIGYLIIREKPENKAQTAKIPAVELPQTAVETTSSQIPQPEMADNFNELKQLASNKADVGLNQIDMRIDSQGQAYLHVVIKKKPVCHPGDYEALTKIFGSSGSALLTLEPMSSDTKIKPISYSINLKQMFQADGFAMPVDLQKRAVYGIYICGNSSSETKCSHKQAVDFNQILENQNMDANKNGIFYYQFAVLGGSDNRVYAGPAERIANVREMNDRDQEKVKDIDLALQKAGSILSSVRSYPPQVRRTNTGWSLELLVAAMDGAACGGG